MKFIITSIEYYPMGGESTDEWSVNEAENITELVNEMQNNVDDLFQNEYEFDTIDVEDNTATFKIVNRSRYKHTDFEIEPAKYEH